MSTQKEAVEELLSTAGVSINGTDPWDIQVNDDRFYRRVLGDGNLGLGESYMDGWWDCERLDEFVFRILEARLDNRVSGGLKYLWPTFTARLLNFQSRRRAGIIAHRHYDTGNDLFMSFLDPYNQYSCGFFDGTEDLHQSQLAKMNLVCRKLDLGEEDHLLDIGCGWGGLASYAARQTGCSVTAVNISAEQLHYAREFCKDLPVHFLDCDYREITGVYGKVVSVGMFEHVGPKNYRAFMKVVHRCLEEDGVFLLHTIGRNESGPSMDPWYNKYIFPNSVLPSMAQITRSVESFFIIEDVHNLGPHYDRTLMAWNDNFQRALPRLRDRYAERFIRMWEYYLLSCAGSFRARTVQVWQIVLTKYGTPQPDCRGV